MHMYLLLLCNVICKYIREVALVFGVIKEVEKSLFNLLGVMYSRPHSNVFSVAGHTKDISLHSADGAMVTIRAQRKTQSSQQTFV